MPQRKRNAGAGKNLDRDFKSFCAILHSGSSSEQLSWQARPFIMCVATVVSSEMPRRALNDPAGDARPAKRWLSSSCVSTRGSTNAEKAWVVLRDWALHRSHLRLACLNIAASHAQGMYSRWNISLACKLCCVLAAHITNTVLGGTHLSLYASIVQHNRSCLQGFVLHRCIPKTQYALRRPSR